MGAIRATVAALGALLAAASPAHAATLALEHVGLDVAEVGAVDGVIGPGETIDLTETLNSSQPGTLTGLQGTLTTSTPGVTIQAGTRAFNDVSFGATTVNAPPFRATVAGSVECGQRLSFGLTVGSGGDSVALPLQVGTGSPDAPVARESGDVPHSIPNPGTLGSSLAVAQSGRVKGVRVRLGHIEHPYVGDLRITLVSPAGTRVVLVDRAGGSGDDFVNTVIGSDGAPIAGGTAPFTGIFRAHGDLGAFDGEQQAGTWRLEVQDTSPADAGSLLSWGTDVRPATCTAQPVAVVDATPNPAQVGQQVSFSAAQSSDPTGEIARYEWDLDGDGAFETDTGTSPVATHTYGARSTVPVQVRITNDRGISDTETVTLSVTQPPAASFTVAPATPLTGQSTTLDGSASGDDDGTLVRWEWDLDGNGTYERDTQGSPFVTASWATPGVRTVRLRVTDDNGATNVTTRDVEVLNRAPVAAVAAPSPVTTSAPAVLDGSGSTDADGTIATYEWDLDGDGTFETDTGAVATVSHTFAAPGAPSVGLRVTDDRGAVATVTEPLVVTHAPDAVIGATPNPARPGDLVSVSAVGSDDADGSVVAYDWDLDGNGSFETPTGAVPTTTKAAGGPGSVTLRVRATDDLGATDVATVVLQVVNDLPVIVLSVPGTAVAGEAVQFSAVGTSDPDGSVTAYAWDLDGNGSFETATGTTPTASRSYPNAGTFPVSVRVTDDDGGTATKTASVVIAAPSDGGGSGGGDGGGGADGGGSGSGGGGGTGETPVSPAPRQPAPGGETPSAPGETPRGQVRFTAWLTGAPMQKVKTVGRKGLLLGCRAEQRAVCSLTFTIAGSAAKKLRLARGAKARKPFTVGRATVAALPGQEAVVVVKLSSRVRRALGKARGRVTVKAVGKAHLATGETIALSRAVLLRR